MKNKKKKLKYVLKAERATNLLYELCERLIQNGVWDKFVTIDLNKWFVETNMKKISILKQ